MTVPLEDLRAAGLDRQFERLEGAVADHLDGRHANVAVVSDPYGGRRALLDYAEEMLEGAAARVALGDTVSGAGPDLPDADAVIVDDCHYLFRRQVGGFAVLDRFLERMALSDRLFLTSWNRYAWRYLSAVRGVADSFPVVVRVPELDAAGIEALIAARFGPDLPEFRDTGEAGLVRSVVFDPYEVDLPAGRSVSVPVPRTNTAWLSSLRTRDEDASIEAVVFEKVRRVANGNPGIATTVWEEAVAEGHEGVIAPAYVRDLDVDFELDDRSAFLLWLVVAAGTARRETLADVTGGPVEKPLATLVDRGICSVEDNRVSVTPMGLAPAVEALRGRGLVW